MLKMPVINPIETSICTSLQDEGMGSLYERVVKAGVSADWREPDVIRVAPVPLYNSFGDVYRFAEVLSDCLQSHSY